MDWPASQITNTLPVKGSVVLYSMVSIPEIYVAALSKYSLFKIKLYSDSGGLPMIPAVSSYCGASAVVIYSL